jgi:hypothetical protein
MIEVPFSRLAAILVVLTAVVGCAGSKPPNYYILRSIQNPGLEVRAEGAQQDLAVEVGPVKIPEYLDRPQIAARSAGNSLQFAEFDKWAEPLEKNLMRVLADNLSAMIPSERVSIFPWPKSMPVQYRVTLEVIHLEKMPDEKVILDTGWNILGSDGENLLVMRRSRLMQPVESAGYEGVVSAESRAVEALSREIAAALRSLAGEPAPH